MKSFNRIQNVLLVAGIALLVISVVLGIADLIGWFELPQFIQDFDSSIKMYARGAVLGCVLAAAGCWNTSTPDTSSQLHSVQHHKE
jgi:hypothetical protein